MRFAAAPLTLLFLALCASDPAPAAEPPSSGPRIVVLGTAQDGGAPHTGCEHSFCARARQDPKLARRVASLVIHFPESNRTFLVDASPDLPMQIKEVRTSPNSRSIS